MANFDFSLIPEELRPEGSSKEDKKVYTLEEARKRLAELRECMRASRDLDDEAYLSKEECEKRRKLYKEVVEVVNSVKI